MSTTIGDIARRIENFAPLSYQEKYDNCGLQTGNPQAEVTGILLTTDVTEGVINEAIAKGCNMIVSHHPLIFQGLKHITGRSYVERCVAMAIKHDIAIYAAHTNADKVKNGVSHKMAQKLGLKDIALLAPEEEDVFKLVTFVPHSHTETVAQALYAAGAGTIGNYDKCSYRSTGQGTFRATDGCNPFCGHIDEYHTEAEDRLEVILRSQDRREVTEALKKAHPYEEPAFDLFRSHIGYAPAGLGVVGTIDKETDETTFLKKVKETFGCGCVRHTALLNRPVKKVALCGGSGIEFLPQAIATGADVYVTADVKYHQFFDADGHILIADIGHYESEQFTKEIFYDVIYEKSDNFVIHYSEFKTNPVNYL